MIIWRMIETNNGVIESGQRGWVSLNEEDATMLYKRVMKIMLKRNRELANDTVMNSQSEYSEQICLTSHISEGITKSKFKKSIARHIYDNLIGM